MRRTVVASDTTTTFFREMAWIAPLPGPLSREPLAYAPTKAPVNRWRSGAWSHFAAYVVQAF